MRLYGVDFTSAPRRRKTITIACGVLKDGRVRLEDFEHCADWPRFEHFLHTPGPWCGAFDFPFGLPRELVHTLGWPTDWAALVAHVAALGKENFRAALNAAREARPAGQRYVHRQTDIPARSHSPMKLVNPPVGLMFLAGAPRLLAAGLHLPGMHAGDGDRVALEAYPGLLARAITKASYKNDNATKHTPARQLARSQIVEALRAGSHPLGLPLETTAPQVAAILEEGSGDLLDATLALVQAAWATQRAGARWGLPEDFDPLEGWIVTA
ncbi:DUF429 domain-containing protein [Uliginosibacterium sp. H1]|uniref:DUF429 domain-containing protein n=1 Tax=Uliginosibacterium sp. H1 TaxID=3114757 RepID=UPI002E196722|nr:DUF429 domain-containing protein [Uliginosibacterium sp. H1]